MPIYEVKFHFVRNGKSKDLCHIYPSIVNQLLLVGHILKV